MVYLDNAATTFPKPEAVYSLMDKVNREMSVNAGRGSYKLAQEASGIITETKQLLRELVKVDAITPVIFAPSITIALNQVILGLDVKQQDVIYASPYEHNAVARTLNELRKRTGCTIRQLPINEESLEIDIEKCKYEFSKDRPKAVISTHISNVTGYILPINDIFTIAKEYGAITVLDTAQSLGLIEMNALQMNVDIIAFAGHKSLYGPFGVGGYINVARVPLDTVIVGGTGSDSLNLDMPQGLEAHYESSSQNIVSIAGLNAALKEINVKKIYDHEIELTQYLVDQLRKISGVRIIGHDKCNNYIGIVSIVVEGYSSSDIGMILDEDFDIAVRTGYHCAPWIHEYLNDKQSLGTVRIGLGQFNTEEDIDIFISALIQINE